MKTRELQKCVVRIERWAGNARQSVGTGFFVSQHGHILTCQHVVGGDGDCRDAELKVYYEEEPCDVDVISLSSNPTYLDYGILQSRLGQLPEYAGYLRLGVWEKHLRVMHNFATYGFRSDFSGLGAEGIILEKISPKDEDDPKAKLLQLKSVDVNNEICQQGMSGAPVYVEETGQVVGVILGQIRNNNVPLAVPIKEIISCEPVISELYKKSEIYDALKKILVSGRWFTQRTLSTLYAKLPDPTLPALPSDGNEIGATILEHYWENNRIDQLAQYLESYIPFIPINRLCHQSNIHFVNRKSELEKAFRDQLIGTDPVSYIFFEAPAGYGKTELLQTIERRYFKEGWFFAYAAVQRQLTSNKLDGLIKRILEQLGCSDVGSLLENSVRAAPTVLAQNLTRLMRQQGPESGSLDVMGQLPWQFGLALLIDNAELLDETEICDCLTFLRDLNALLTKFSRMNDIDIPFKVRIAGRHNAYQWQQLAEKQNLDLEIVPLSPFQPGYVNETLRRKYPILKQRDTYAAWLMYMTGGHPGCMVNIIDRMGRIETNIDDEFLNRFPENKQNVMQTIEKIEQSIPVALRPYFEKLSVFRCYSIYLLEKIMDEGIIPNGMDAHVLEEELTRNFLVSRPDNYIRDNIVRRLFALRLLWNDKTLYIQTCRQALRMYTTELKEIDDDAASMLLECLYQEIQILYHSSAKNDVARADIRQKFFEGRNGRTAILKRYLDLIYKKRRFQDIVRNFVKHIKKDDDAAVEFRFNLDFMMRPATFDNSASERLLEETRKFVHLKGLRLRL